MDISILRRNWQAAHPGGNVWMRASNGELFESGKLTGQFAVTYSDGGKVYTYRYKSVYSLAERLNMIPPAPSDYMAESRRAIASLRRGETFETLCGVNDTIRHILKQETGLDYIVRYDSGQDEYGRETFIIHTIEEYKP